VPLIRAGVFIRRKKRESSSFLKKRTKKLLSIAGGTTLALLKRQLAAISKSFLFLFFKKEILRFVPDLLMTRLASCPSFILQPKPE
jgi:hypothetical protein